MEKLKCKDYSEGDCIFTIYPDETKFINKDEKLKAITEKLNEIRKEVDLLSGDYIWHNDSFDVKVMNVFDESPASFGGKLNYGENIEDEWFLVYLLLELSNTFEDLVIRVSDSDGEFLLIEAAEHLPSWVSPETCDGRVFLHKGHVHILPQSFCPPDEDDENEEFLVTQEVLDFIRSRPNDSKVKPSIEKPIWKRIAKFRDQMDTLTHNAVVYIPVAVAALLEQEPSLVTSAVRAFCDRDLIDLRACRAMKYFPPEQRVLSKVKFTKCSYAMLVSSKFQPDKRTGWDLPPPTNEAYKAHLLGIKLACGFEILLNQAKGRQVNGNENDNDDVNEDPAWLKMKTRLEAMNYFRGLLVHSKEYNELLNKAKDFFRHHCVTNMEAKGAAARLASLVANLEIDMDGLKRRETGLSFESADDSWMDVTKEQLDEMLASRFGTGPNMAETTKHPTDIASHLKSFISHISGIDGAEFPNRSSNKEPVPARPARGVKKKKKNVKFSSDTKLHSVTSNDQISQANQRVNIEPEGFITAVQNILDFSIPEDNYWESEGSGMSSYEDEDEMDLVESSNKQMNQTMASYMKEMDKELSSTTMGQSFVKKQVNKENSQEGFDDIEDFEPVDIDMNALKNIIMSYKTQLGEPGPSETLLGPMGINLQDIDADVD